MGLMQRAAAVALLACFSAYPSYSRQTEAGSFVDVEEQAISVSFEKGGLEIKIPVRHSFSGPMLAEVEVELVAPDESAWKQISRQVQLKPQSRASVVRLQMPISASDWRAEVWDEHRMRYRVRSQASDQQPAQAAAILDEGVVALSRACRDNFALSLAMPDGAAPGERVRIWVLAEHPDGFGPSPGVQIRGRLEEPEGAQAQAKTGPDGLAALEFDLPADLAGRRIEVQFEGRRRGLVRQLSSSLWLHRRYGQLFVTTDKPLYQPGQTLHMRLLAIHPSGRAWPGANFWMTVADPARRQVFRQLVTTTQLGAATADWSIPETIRHGRFSITAESDQSEEAHGYRSVEIRTYRLPAFFVEAEPDRSFYLPGQEVNVEIRARHLSGEALLAGKVRIVRQQRRRWLYRRQQWDLKEETVAQGELERSGRFAARLDLEGVDPFEKINQYQRYLDQDFTAYLTDPLTGRTEQRRFVLRFSPDPIHIYLSQSRPMAGERQGYVTTFYADGRPAQCQVQVRDPGLSAKAPPLAEVQANRYGVARLRMPVLGLPETYSEVQLIAWDSQGQQASWRQEIRQGESIALRMQIGQTIYRPGEGLQIDLKSKAETSTAFVEIYKSGRLLLTRKAALNNGQAALRIPYRPDFSGLLSINAYSPPTPRDDPERFSVMEQVVYPGSGLEVEARTAPVYRPGQKARAEFRVTQKGRPVKSALGVVIADRGIDERLRSDREGRNLGWHGADLTRLTSDPLRPLERFGIPYRQLDLSQPIPSDVQLAAGAAFNASHYAGARRFGELDPQPDYQEAFHDWFEQQAGRVEEALSRGGELFRDSSRPDPELDDLLRASGLTLADMPDPWGNPYQPDCGPDYAQASLALRSSGPDERPGSPDDFTALRIRWPYYNRVQRAIRQAALNFQRRTLQLLQDQRTLKDELAKLGIDLDALRDPCGAPLRPNIGFEKQLGVVRLTSAGKDRRFDTPDDYRAARQSWLYFKPLNEILGRAVAQHHERTGSLLWDAESARREFLRLDVDLDALRDPWGNPYRLKVKVENYLHSLSLHSDGANGRFDSVDQQGRRDDFMVWQATLDYFLDEGRQVVEAIDSYQQRSGKVPASAEELAAALSDSSLELLDPWNRPFRLVWSKLERTFESLCISQRAVYGQSPQERIDPGTTTLQSALASWRSAGRDGLPGNGDDFDAVRLTLVLEQRKNPHGAASERARWLGLPSGIVDQPEGSGAIAGVVTDAMGAVIPGAEITATHETIQLSRTVISGDTGCYFIDRLPAGLYSVRFNLTGFQQLEIVDVPVAESLQTPLDGRLEVGDISETITVSAGPDPVHTQSARIAGQVPVGASESVSTPRLRQYFPETLVWAPLLETDRMGRAELDFTVADNITTWDLSVLASTADGKIQSGRTSFRSFQPFFAQPDPPPILTVGDEIHLPVAVYNHLDQAQSVQLEMAAGEWFQPLGPTQQSLHVPARDASQAFFPIRAVRVDSEARPRVTARAEDASDAVEKTLSVLPYGEEIVRVDNRLLMESAAFEVAVPDEALPGTIRSELKIYPDMISHAFDGVEGIIRRPYGCAEQTISSSYANLIALRALEPRAPDSPVVRQARNFLEKGYRRLVRFQAPQGGFSYWGGTAEAVPEVSIHAWQFLTDAQGWIDVDQQLTKSTLNWLLEHQQDDGSWLGQADLTGLMARTLSARQAPQEARQALRRSIQYLAAQVDQQEGAPYMLANFVSAALQSGAGQTLKPVIRRAAARLIETARNQVGSCSWLNQGQTPFRGWGKAGEIETTAVAARALRLVAESRLFADDPLASQALSRAKGAELFLALSKDQFGVWYSTQATFAALEALSRFQSSRKAGEGLRVEATVNGHRTEAERHPGKGDWGPLRLDLSAHLASGANRIEVEPGPETAGALAHLVVRYRREWPDARQEAASSSDLSFRVHFDRDRLKLGEEVTCQVEVERLAWSAPRGWRRRPGMLLAEVGLPPGVQVDHASLQQEMKRLGWLLGRYEVQPDRLVLYIWPRFGNRLQISFGFRPLFAMRARSAPSQLYDYYSPQARLSLAPTLFSVSPKSPGKEKRLF